ncbi:MAG: hypothetical protein ACYSSI_02780 [Planctomycetota bacterium]|jgi:hypothetical protein
MRTLVLILVLAVLAIPAISEPIPLASDSTPVNLKVMPTAVVSAPGKIDVEITDVDVDQLGSSSGMDSEPFLIGTNLAQVQIEASIGVNGISGGTWGCMLQGDPDGIGFVPTYGHQYSGPIPDGTPFSVFVKVTGVDMTTVAFSQNFVHDTTLTLTMSVP